MSAPILSHLARAISRTISQIGTTVDVYTPSQTVLSDRNVVPNAYTRSSIGLKVAIVPDESARDRATALGVYAPRVGFAYVKSDEVSLVGDRYILLETLSGQAWVVHGEPIVPSDPAAVGAECLISSVKVKPDGVP